MIPHFNKYFFLSILSTSLMMTL